MQTQLLQVQHGYTCRGAKKNPHLKNTLKAAQQFKIQDLHHFYVSASRGPERGLCASLPTPSVLGRV